MTRQDLPVESRFPGIQLITKIKKKTVRNIGSIFQDLIVSTSLSWNTQMLDQMLTFYLLQVQKPPGYRYQQAMFWLADWGILMVGHYLFTKKTWEYLGPRKYHIMSILIAGKIILY